MTQELDWHEPTGWPTDATADRLIGDWHLYQRKAGHRTSTDDLITAWYAIHRTRSRGKLPQNYLDLGCGVGSVLLMVCHNLQPAHAQGVEAQAQSVAMAKRSIDELPLHPCKIDIAHSDFRDYDFSANTYDLVTGSPPYFPLNTGVLPNDAQRKACRFEARGGVESYLSAAATALAPNAYFYLVFQHIARDRVMAAGAESGLHLTGQADFLMREDREAPFLSVFEFSKQESSEIHSCRTPVRDSQGELSAAYLTIRQELGVSLPSHLSVL